MAGRAGDRGARGVRDLLPLFVAGLLGLALVVSLAACSDRESQVGTPAGTTQETTSEPVGTSASTTGETGAAEPTGSAAEDSPTPEADGASSQDATDPASLEPTVWSEAQSPNYVRLVGEAQIANPLDPGQVVYADLDGLGRTGQVRACITKQMMDEGRARERGDTPDPAGWPRKNQKVQIQLPTGKAYRGYLWNRCHLLAKSLGGIEVRENLVTGTRMLNVGANDGQGGMDMYESAIRDWLTSYPDVTVQYVATPVYQGNELIPRSVYVDVLSSDGAINERLETYNAAKGYVLDYAKGTFTQE